MITDHLVIEGTLSKKAIMINDFLDTAIRVGLGFFFLLSGSRGTDERVGAFGWSRASFVCFYLLRLRALRGARIAADVAGLFVCLSGLSGLSGDTYTLKLFFHSFLHRVRVCDLERRVWALRSLRWGGWEGKGACCVCLKIRERVCARIHAALE